MTFPSKEDLTLSAWAYAYAETGWPVFPLAPRSKRPIPTRGVLQATTRLDVVQAWWDTIPEANIGIATGHGFDVFDVDGTIGVAFLDELLGERYRHDGPLSQTGKGWHMLFAPTGRPNGTNLGGTRENETKLDFRGAGGYIVAPPSIHPLGHRYLWSPDRGPELALPPAPEWLLGLLNRDDNPTVAGGPNTRHAIRRASPTEKAVNYLQHIEDGIIPMDQLPRGLRQRFERPDILEACAERGIQLRKRTHYYVGRCPYHDDSDPSMAVYPSNNTWYCYGCGAHGDSFDLLNRTHL